MHADPQAEAFSLGVQGSLDGDGTAQCLHCAGELHQKPVAHSFEQAPTVGGRQGSITSVRSARLRRPPCWRVCLRLRNAIERAVVLARGDVITRDHLPDNEFRESPDSTAASTSRSLEEMERELIVRVLAESPTLEDAAQTLGINASTLWRKRKRYKSD